MRETAGESSRRKERHDATVSGDSTKGRTLVLNITCTFNRQTVSYMVTMYFLK